MRKVASLLGIDISTYAKIEREERYLGSHLITSLAEILATESEELYNHYYSSKMIAELKGYGNYKDVLTLVNDQLEQYTKKQVSLSFTKKWTEKAFSNPKSITRVATVFSGIGAIEYAFKRLKLKTEIVFASDIDKYVKESYFNLSLIHI